VGVQVKLWNPSRTCAIPERFCSGDSLWRGAISSVCTFTFYLLGEGLHRGSMFNPATQRFLVVLRCQLSTLGHVSSRPLVCRSGIHCLSVCEIHLLAEMTSDDS